MHVRGVAAGFLLLGLIGFRSPAGTLAQTDDWMTNGLPEAVSAVAMSPSSDSILLAAGSTGVWQSTDAGTSWSKVSPTVVHAALSFDASAVGTVWAASGDTNSILKSTDGGVTWATSYTTSGQGHVNTVLADPNTTGRVYSGITDAAGLAQIVRSTDAGANWSPLLPASLQGASGIGQTLVGQLAMLPGTPGLVLAGVGYYHGGGVLRSTDSGASWSAAYTGSLTPQAGPSALAVGHNGATTTIYAGLNVQQFGSLVRSDDSGATWTKVGLPIQASNAGGYVSNILLDPTQPDTAYVSEWDTSTPPNTGVFASGDRGQTWTELGHLAAQVVGPQGLALAASTQTVYAATGSGVYQYGLASIPCTSS